MDIDKIQKHQYKFYDFEIIAHVEISNLSNEWHTDDDAEDDDVNRCVQCASIFDVHAVGKRPLAKINSDAKSCAQSWNSATLVGMHLTRKINTSIAR